MTSFLRSILLLLWITLPLPIFPQTGDLERISPESQGLSSSAVKAYFDAMLTCPTGEPHGLMILRHGKVVGEFFPKPFEPNQPQLLYSAAKTFTGLAVVLAIEENRLKLTDRVATFFPEQLPDSISDHLASMTVRDLLTMTSGIQPDPLMRTTGAEWIRRYLSKPVSQPGEAFHYDSMCSYLLSAIVQRVTGEKLLDYLRRKIFDPLHITTVDWEESPEGINTGGWGLRMHVESMAKFGQLLLNKGEWEGKRLISPDWVEEMTSSLQETGMPDTYGYHTWRCDYPNAYRADGALGQYIIVAPDEDMVVAITQANSSNGVAERQLVWKLLRQAKKEPLPESSAYTALLQTQNTSSLPVAPAKKRRTRCQSLLLNKQASLGTNGLEWKTLRLESASKDSLQLTVTTTSGEEYTISAGLGEWHTNQTDAHPPYSIKAVGRFQGIHPPFPVASCFGEDNEQLTIKVRYTNWGFGADLHFRITEGQLSLKVKETGKREAYNVPIALE